MFKRVAKSGASWGGKTYETPSHTKLYLTIAHLDSRESAKKEYDEWIRKAVGIINQGKVQDRPATTEDRAEIIVPATQDCKEATSIIGTVGTAPRIISCCSSESSEVRRHQAALDRVLYRDELTQTASLL
jgi:hypothetical protein